MILRIEAAIGAAQADGAHGAVASNHALILKIIELVNEQNAAQHQYAGAMTFDEIMATLIDEVGPHDTIEICTKAIEAARARLADQAIVVS